MQHKSMIQPEPFEFESDVHETGLEQFEQEFESFEAMLGSYIPDDCTLKKKKPTAPSCQFPLAGTMPGLGTFSAPSRNGTRWYTPTRGDNLWSLSETILEYVRPGRYSPPTATEIANLSEAIKKDPCNNHIRGLMFLPRFKCDRFTRGGSYYGSIHILAKW